MNLQYMSQWGQNSFFLHQRQAVLLIYIHWINRMGLDLKFSLPFKQVNI